MLLWGNEGGRMEGVNLHFSVVVGELRHPPGLPGGGGESFFVIL